MSDPPIGKAVGATLMVLGLFIFFWSLVALWVALDPLSR